MADIDESTGAKPVTQRHAQSWIYSGVGRHPPHGGQGSRDALRRVSNGIDERLKKANVDDLTGHLIRFYDPETVRRVTKTLSNDER